jgi:hypothetical protein
MGLTSMQSTHRFIHYNPFPMNPLNQYSNPKKEALLKTLVFTSILMTGNALATLCYGQDGNAGINQATSQVKSYFDSGCSLMYAIGAVVGIIGAIKVFNKWNAGEPDTNKVAAAWFGSCIFLVVVATVLKSFFGL